MIRTHSDDPDVNAAAAEAGKIIADTLAKLPEASTYDYGGHILTIGEYDVCTRCTKQIAEAQAAARALAGIAHLQSDRMVAEHIDLAARLFTLEAQAAEIRAELHNGHDSEPILNSVLGYIYDRKIQDSYEHTHHGGHN